MFVCARCGRETRSFSFTLQKSSLHTRKITNASSEFGFRSRNSWLVERIRGERDAFTPRTRVYPTHKNNFSFFFPPRLVLTRWTRHVTAVVGRDTWINVEISKVFETNGVRWEVCRFFVRDHFSKSNTSGFRYDASKTCVTHCCTVPTHACNNYYDQRGDHKKVPIVTEFKVEKKKRPQVSRKCETRTNFQKICILTQIKFFCVFFGIFVNFDSNA